MSDLTPEALKQNYAEAVAKTNTFQTHGVSPDAAKAYLKSPEGIRYLIQLNAASPELSVDKLRERAINQISSGAELPRMETLNEPLVKIVPKGQQPSPYSPFWAKEADLDAAVREGKNLSHHFALPVGSESTQYDVYRIKPKAPTEVFVNTVAPTSELDGQVSKPGGARQYLTPNRQLYEPHEFVKTVDNHLHLPIKGHGIRPAIKAAGVLGTAYGAYDAKDQIDAAIDTARSNREQWVRGAEESTNQAVKTVVTGTAATVGAVPGAALGTLTSPVTGPAGPVVGGLTTGSLTAYGAEKAYEDSSFQRATKTFGREVVGRLGYDYVSNEGRLLRQVNGLKEELQTSTDPAERARLQGRLNKAGAAFGKEAERNGRYFEARAGIDKGWEQMQLRFPKVDKDEVNDALGRRIDAGKKPADAVRGAFSDAVHEHYPRALPHVPLEDYRTLNAAQLAEKHQHYAAEVVHGRRAVQALMANQDSHNNVDQGWPKALAQQRQAARVEEGRNELWRDTGHLSAIRNAYKERGLQPPELPVELRSDVRDKPPQGAQGAQPSQSGGRPSTAHPAPPARLGPVSQQLLQDGEREVAQVAQRHGLAWDQGMRNTSAAVAATARESGMERVNLLRANGGQIHLAHFDGVQVRDAWVDAKVAANTPQEQSLQRMQDADGRADWTERAVTNREASKPNPGRAHEGPQPRAEVSPALV